MAVAPNVYLIGSIIPAPSRLGVLKMTCAVPLLQESVAHSVDKRRSFGDSPLSFQGCYISSMCLVASAWREKYRWIQFLLQQGGHGS